MKAIDRLVCFGDSFTYGHGLEDCQAFDPPSQYAWPNLLGERLGVSIINKSKPGSSNIEMLMEVLNFNFEKTDLVIIGWTYIARDMLFKKKQRLDPWGDKISKLWLKLYNDYDLSVRSGLYIDHASLYLHQKGIQNHHFYAVEISVPQWFGHTPPTLPQHSIVNLHKGIFPKLDKATDKMHPGILSQRALSENLFRIVK